VNKPTRAAIIAAVTAGLVTVPPAQETTAILPDSVQIQTGQHQKTQKATPKRKPKVVGGRDPLAKAAAWPQRIEAFVERRKAREAARIAAAKAREAAMQERIKDALRPSRTSLAGNRELGHQMMLDAGWDESQWTYLEKLWTRESQWTTTANNPSSGAYGIPQALPGSKMATAGADWQTNPATQIKWGLGYIRDRYGSPQNAWAHSESVGWY